MNDVNEIQKVLSRMITLLRVSGIDNWADVFDDLQFEVEKNPMKTLSKIMSMYGGMGSLNDLVLYKNGQLLFDENKEFCDLRTQLHILCRR